MKTMKKRALALAITTATLPAAAKADIVTLDFTGTYPYMPPVPGRFSGRLQFDTDVAATGSQFGFGVTSFLFNNSATSDYVLTDETGTKTIERSDISIQAAQTETGTSLYVYRQSQPFVPQLGLFLESNIRLPNGLPVTYNISPSQQFAGFAATTDRTTGTVTSVTSTVQVTSAPAVPEPASWAMMTAGVGLLGAAMRRSRKSKVSTKASLSL